MTQHIANEKQTRKNQSKGYKVIKFVPVFESGAMISNFTRTWYTLKLIGP